MGMPPATLDQGQNMTTPDILQDFGALANVRIGLSTEVRSQSVRALNRQLAHTMAIRDTYKKAHWQVSGATFHQLHLLFDQHYTEQVAIMDAIAERVQTLGGVTFALAQDVMEESSISRTAPRGRESAAAQMSRLLDAHETILIEARPLARLAAESGDDGTNDLIVSQVVRSNELQSWFIGEHLAAQTQK
jgi:starvation-inducible DNA-binding protein